MTSPLVVGSSAAFGGDIFSQRAYWISGKLIVVQMRLFTESVATDLPSLALFPSSAGLSTPSRDLSARSVFMTH